MNSFGVNDTVIHITDCWKNGSIFIGKKISSKILEKVRSPSTFGFKQKKKNHLFTHGEKKASAVIQRTVFSGLLMLSSTITARDGKCSDFLY